MGIFDFLDSPAIETKNPSLLDQILAVEWLRDNISAYSGDPSRMALAGHSAGSQSIAYSSYAYKNDAMVSGLVELSGQPGLIATDDGSSWKCIVNITVCSNTNTSTELACMRTVPA